MLILSVVSYATDNFKHVRCEGLYKNHLQGIAVNNGKIFWSHTDVVVRTNLEGQIEKLTLAPFHHGDCCVSDNKLYVAVSIVGKNKTIKNILYVYDFDLNLVKKIPLNLTGGTIGTIGWHNGFFYVSGGFFTGEGDNKKFKIFKLDKDFNVVEIFLMPANEIVYGPQTICWAYGRFWLGVYPRKGLSSTNLKLWEVDENFNIVKKHKVNASVGFVPINNADGKNFLVAQAKIQKNTYAGCSAVAKPIKIQPSEIK